MRGVLAPATLAALLLSGCVSPGSYARPSVDLPAAYSNSSLHRSAATPAISDRWWTAFNDPMLNRLVEEALAGSLSVEAAAARLQQAAAGVRAARAAQFPAGTISGSAAIQRQSLEEPFARAASQFPGFNRTQELYGLSAAAAWEIDLFGRLSAGRRAARADAQAAEAGVAGARLTVAAEVATAYLGARELQQRIGVARERVRTLGRLEQLVRLRLANGVAASLEADQVAADLSTARAVVPVLQAALEVELNRIDVLIGRAPGRAATEIGDGQVPAAPAIAVADGPAALLLRRPDLVAAERAVAAADARTAQAIADYYPRVTVGGLIGLLSGGIGGLFAESALQTAGSAGFSGRLFDFGRVGAQVAGARGRTREAVAEYRQAVLRAAGEVENGLSALARRGEQASELERSEASLQRARNTSRLAYEAGAVSLIEALDAERRLQVAQDSAATARAEAARAAVATFRALGGGWSTDEPTITVAASEQ